MLNLGEIVRWSTVDSSPQAGWDWVMHGHCTINSGDVVRLFRIGLRLQRLAGDGDIDAGEECMDELRAVFKLRLNMPTAVGSGRADVRYKAHAMLHGERLTAPSWRAACSLSNSMFTLTGFRVTNGRGWSHAHAVPPWFHGAVLAEGAPVGLRLAITFLRRPLPGPPGQPPRRDRQHICNA
ncbi:unnamed protein product, partial [Prorocentrum cordatum]